MRYTRDITSRDIGPAPDRADHSMVIEKLNADAQAQSHSGIMIFLTPLAAVRPNATMEAFLATLETCIQLVLGWPMGGALTPQVVSVYEQLAYQNVVKTALHVHAERFRDTNSSRSIRYPATCIYKNSSQR